MRTRGPATRTRRELITLMVLTALLATGPADLALAKGGKKKKDDAADAKGKDKDGKQGEKKADKLDAAFKTALKAAKAQLAKGEDGVAKLLAALDDKDLLELNLNAGESHNFSKKQASTKLRDWLKANQLTIGKRKSVVDKKSASFSVELRNPQKRAGTLRLTFVADGKSYRLRGIVVRVK